MPVKLWSDGATTMAGAFNWQQRVMRLKSIDNMIWKQNHYKITIECQKLQ